MVLGLLDPDPLVRGMDPAVLKDIDNLAEVMRSVVAASEATRTREKVATELQPLTKVPEKWGHNSQIANIRLYNVPNFSGSKVFLLYKCWKCKKLYFSKFCKGAKLFKLFVILEINLKCFPSSKF